MANKTCIRSACECSSKTADLAKMLMVVGFLKQQGIEFRSVLDDFDVSFRVEFSLKLGGELKHIDAFHHVSRMHFFPRFLQGRRRCQMTAARCYRCDEYAHKAMDLARRAKAA